MTLVLEREVVPGLVAFADPEVMHASNVCRTNMPREHVLGVHPFLVVDVDTGGVVTALPLFSRPLPSRVLLDESRKRGLSFKWRQRESYFCKWEFWRAPVAIFCAATEERGNARRRPSPLRRRRSQVPRDPHVRGLQQAPLPPLDT